MTAAGGSITPSRKSRKPRPTDKSDQGFTNKGNYPMEITTTPATVFATLAAHLQTHPELGCPNELGLWGSRYNTAPSLQVMADVFRSWLETADSYNVGRIRTANAAHYADASITIAGVRFEVRTNNGGMSLDKFEAMVEVEPLVKVAS